MAIREVIEEIIDFHFLLDCLKKEIEGLRNIDEYQVSKDVLYKKIQKSKALAYLVSVSLQVLEKAKLEEELKELREMVEEIRR